MRNKFIVNAFAVPFEKLLFSMVSSECLSIRLGYLTGQETT